MPIPVWGSGEQTVDAVDSLDVARMLVDATRFGDDDIFDAGTGIPVSVNAIAGFVNGITGNEAGIEHLPMRDGERPDTRIVAGGAGWEKLGWHPQLSWSRIKQVVDWYGDEPRLTAVVL